MLSTLVSETIEMMFMRLDRILHIVKMLSYDYTIKMLYTVKYAYKELIGTKKRLVNWFFGKDWGKEFVFFKPEVPYKRILYKRSLLYF